MSSIVADELAKIKSFETETEKRRSELTLNELNYISDKQLHKKGGGSGPVEWDMLGLVAVGSTDPPELLAGDYSKLREKFENAISTGTFDEPVYIGLLVQMGSHTPLYSSFTIEPDNIQTLLGEDAMYFVTEVSSDKLVFKSDNTFEWFEQVNH